jgi:hypothetical protein
MHSSRIPVIDALSAATSLVGGYRVTGPLSSQSLFFRFAIYDR